MNRWKLLIQELDIRMSHISGKETRIGDFLSRMTNHLLTVLNLEPAEYYQ